MIVQDNIESWTFQVIENKSWNEVVRTIFLDITKKKHMNTNEEEFLSVFQQFQVLKKKLSYQTLWLKLFVHSWFEVNYKVQMISHCIFFTVQLSW